ncbi:MAG: hypothetical protein NTU84_05540 [Verrucomicrobia bacterium]|jgi:hypothetical protein|nr:hypothetical protein [Verrucomicrobiota bacterium]
MKALTNLIFLILMLIGIPVFLYYMYTKTYASKKVETSAMHAPSVKNDIRIKNLEIARLKKENAELKTRELRPLAQPPRPLGQGIQSANPNSQSLLSQPPRRIGRNSNSCEPNQEYGQMDHLHE